MSPAITPAAARSTAAFGPAPALNKAGSSEDSSSTDDNNDASGKSNNAGGGTEGGNANVNNIPAPLDLSAIPAPAPPLHRNGGKFGSSGSSASKPVVLQGAALESLKRLGRPGSSVSDRSKGLGSARGADMTVPLGAAIPMAVPLGAVVRPLGSNNLLSEKNQKQLRSREISKDFHTTGSFIEKSERSSGTAAARTESLASSSLSGGGLAWARSKSGVSGVSSSRGRRGRPAGFGGSIVGEAVPEVRGGWWGSVEIVFESLIWKILFLVVLVWFLRGCSGALSLLAGGVVGRSLRAREREGTQCDPTRRPPACGGTCSGGRPTRCAGPQGLPSCFCVRGARSSDKRWNATAMRNFRGENFVDPMFPNL